MSKNTVVLLIFVLLSLCLARVSTAGEITWDLISKDNLNFTVVLVNPQRPQIIYAGSINAVLKSEDGGERWRNVLFVKGQNTKVNYLFLTKGVNSSLYAATGNGLFKSNDEGENWTRIFRGKDYLENECMALIEHSNCIYLGTKNGLFTSKDNGCTWHRQNGNLANSQIFVITLSLKENSLFVACSDGVFKSMNSNESWEKVFVENGPENQEAVEEINEDDDDVECVSKIKYMAIDAFKNTVFLATTKGVYSSLDNGSSWNPLSCFGLLEKEIRFLLVSADSVLYCLTKSGVYSYKQQRWYELSEGLCSQSFNFLDLDKRGDLYVASEKGLFKARVISENAGITKENIVASYYKNEPKINELRLVATKYAEVEPEKIKRWRKQAAGRAFLPRVSAGINRDAGDLWHWESGSSTKAGDDALIKGRDSLDWDVTLSWDLGDIIWSDAQTSIDVRSRLMVQLREEILDEVNKIYFERIRLKMEIDNLSIEDRKKRFEKELKLQELTASLDALTGGYFSKQIKEKL
ncbi:MAG: hypothetical protein V1699_00740 [Candidatus Omnitrophota bacterium]